MPHSQRIHKKLSITEIIKRMVFIAIGAIIMAVGLELFLVPNKILDGGVVGISIILSHLTGIKLGLFIFILNIPFFFIGYKQIGKTFALSTVFGITILSFAISYLHQFDVLTKDLLLATVFGGLTIGVGIGIVVKVGGALDGTEILSILIEKKTPFSVGEIIMFFNVFIFGIAGLVFGFDRAMYSAIAYFIAFKVIDIVMEGLDESKSALIISDYHKEIGEAIINELGRTVTYMHGEGGYTGDERKVVYCIITRLEEVKLKTIVDEIDSCAFIAISHVSEVKGKRFKNKSH